MSKVGLCCYCGEEAKITRDHVPPANLFPKPRPNNLVTVPACKKCHSTAWSQDDEYFRLKICLSSDAGGHPKAQKVAASALRSLKRSQARGLHAQIREDTFETWIRSDNGMSRRIVLAYQVDQERIFSTIVRVTRGLFCHEIGERLAPDTTFRVFSDYTLQDWSPEIRQCLMDEVVTPLSSLPVKIIGEGVFSYRHFVEHTGDVVNSAWALTFYGGMSFLVLTRSDQR